MSNGKHLGKGSSIPSLPDDGKLRLYSMRFCPYAQRVHLVLDAKEIPYHTVFINLTEKPEWLVLKSPLGKVPALELPKEKGNPTLHESLTIAEYLDEKYPEKLLYPKDPLAKAQDKLLIDKFNFVSIAMYKVMYENRGSLSDIVESLDPFEVELGKRGTAFYGGSKPSMLDYMIWPWCERSDMLKAVVGDKYELDNKRFAKLIKWKESMKEDPAVKKSLLTPDIHIKYWETRKSGHPDYDMLVNNECKRQKIN